MPGLLLRVAVVSGLDLYIITTTGFEQDPTVFLEPGSGLDMGSLVIPPWIQYQELHGSSTTSL
jgi:hypothetical protein